MSSYAITGASKGIGREFVRQLATDPNNTVLAIVRNPESPEISEFASKYTNVHLIAGDVTDPKSILNAASAASAITGGKLDVLIHNSNAVDAATMGFNPTQIPFDSEATRAIFEPPMSTAIYGGLWTTNAFLPLIEKGTQKKIVHISSAMAEVDLIRSTGISYAVAYSVAKAGMNVQIAKYAAELAPRGIKVLGLSPGWVDTWEGELTIHSATERLNTDVITGEKPSVVVEADEFMLKQFQSIVPSLKGQIAPEESVAKGIQVIENMDEKSSGLLLSHNGNRENWF
ncbi:NAD(P)-binding protein [Penicillium herquei]|nr:NAD(P)-binding protein [Penicillium herquei]